MNFLVQPYPRLALLQTQMSVVTGYCIYTDILQAECTTDCAAAQAFAPAHEYPNAWDGWFHLQSLIHFSASAWRWWIAVDCCFHHDTITHTYLLQTSADAKQ